LKGRAKPFEEFGHGLRLAPDDLLDHVVDASRLPRARISATAEACWMRNGLFDEDELRQ
jgi:hypothetical protein